MLLVRSGGNLGHLPMRSMPVRPSVGTGQVGRSSYLHVWVRVCVRVEEVVGVLTVVGLVVQAPIWRLSHLVVMVPRMMKLLGMTESLLLVLLVLLWMRL